MTTYYKICWQIKRFLLNNLTRGSGSLGSETLGLLLADLRLRTLFMTQCISFLFYTLQLNNKLTAGLAAFLAAAAAFLASLDLEIAA